MSKEKRPNEVNRLTDLTRSAATEAITPNDPTKELFNNEAKDRRLYKFAKTFAKRDFHDRHKTLAFVLMALAYVGSIVSSSLSFPFLNDYLTADVPDYNMRMAAVIGILLLIEFVKHASMMGGFKTLFVYRKVPFISAAFLVLAVSLSVYLCINGVRTSTEANYKPPTYADVSTQYDKQINDLKAANEKLFDRANWKGRLNSSSKDGKAYAERESLITSLTAKAATERENKLSKATAKYDKKHVRKSSFRQYAGYFVEGGIVFCSLFFLYWSYASQFEHLARLSNKFATSFNEIGNMVGNAMGGDGSAVATAKTDTSLIGFKQSDNGDNAKTNKSGTNLNGEDFTALIRAHKTKLSAYKWKLKNGKGSEKNNRNKIAHYTAEIERLSTLTNTKP